MKEFKLSKPLKYEDKQIEVLKLDFDGLTGEDLLNASEEARTMDAQIMVMETAKEYQAALAAKAANIDFGAMKKIGAKDFNKLTSMAQSFLLELE